MTTVRSLPRARRAAPPFGRAWAPLLAAAVAACCSSCSTQPPAAEEPLPEPLPFSMSLDIDEVPTGLASSYGDAQEWRQSLLAAFEASRLCQAVLDGENADVEVADVEVAVTISAKDPALAGARTEIDAPSAVVTAIAWSCVPPLQLFVRDVAVSPDLLAKVKWKRAGSDSSWEDDSQGPFYTSYLERYPLFSWETLGSIFVPPFVFAGGDRDHMLPAIASRVRAEAARAIAKELRGRVPHSDDLLTNLELRREGDTVTFNASGSADLWKIVLRVDGLDDPLADETVPPRPRSGRAEPITPIPIVLDATQRPALLRIEAVSRIRDKSSERYSLRIDDEALSPPATDSAQ